MVDEDRARAYAIAAQANERTASLVKGLVDPAPKSEVLRAEPPSANTATAPSGFASSLATLRGLDQGGGRVLDRAA